VHTALVHLAPIVAAEKSKVPFYVAGGLLAVWAMVLSLGLGLRHASFPRTLGGERGVIAVSVVLVLGAASTAVITAGTPASSAQAPSAQAPSAPSPGGAPPASTPSGGPPPAASTPAGSAGTGGTAPRATTGTTSRPSSPLPSAAGSSIKLAAGPGAQLSFDSKQLSAKAGKASIAFTNTTPIEHNVTVAQGSKVLGATPTFVGGSRTLTLTLARGTYTFYCSVPGHRQAGMEGTLSVS
jgi:plastocyanin